MKMVNILHRFKEVEYNKVEIRHHSIVLLRIEEYICLMNYTKGRTTGSIDQKTA
jgi:hypothetical protein